MKKVQLINMGTEGIMWMCFGDTVYVETAYIKEYVESRKKINKFFGIASKKHRVTKTSKPLSLRIYNKKDISDKKSA